MTQDQLKGFFERIDQVEIDQRPRFGKMNASQMICHCADQIRMALGTKKALEYGKSDPKRIITRAKEGKPVSTPKGFGQVEGLGTKPTNFEDDKKILKEHILVLLELPEDHEFALHPYFGNVSKKRWLAMLEYHLNHHLSQFEV